MKSSHLLFSAFSTLISVLFFGCKKGPDLSVPERVPYTTFLPFQPFNYAVPTAPNGFLQVVYHSQHTNFAVFPNVYNEIYSITRFDPNLQDSITLFWNRELYYLNGVNPFTGVPDSTFLPVKIGETVAIYRLECNTGNEAVEEAHDSQSEIIIQVVNGTPTIIGSAKPSIPPLQPGTCTTLVSHAQFQGPFQYQVTTTVDTEDDVPEEEEKNNTYFEPNVDQLRTQ